MILGTTGSRFGLSAAQRAQAVLLLDGRRERWPKPSRVDHGDCLGVDYDIFQIACQLHIMTVSHPPINNKLRAYCASDIILAARPYEERNQDIASMTERLVGFPSGEERVQLRSGTWQTIRYAAKLRRSVLIIYADGREEAR